MNVRRLIDEYESLLRRYDALLDHPQASLLVETLAPRMAEIASMLETNDARGVVVPHPAIYGDKSLQERLYKARIADCKRFAIGI